MDSCWFLRKLHDLWLGANININNDNNLSLTKTCRNAEQSFSRTASARVLPSKLFSNVSLPDVPRSELFQIRKKRSNKKCIIQCIVLTICYFYFSWSAHPVPISVEIDELFLGDELIVRQTRLRVKHEGKRLVRNYCCHPNEQEVQENVSAKEHDH